MAQEGFENQEDPIAHLKWGKYIDDPNRRKQHIVDVYQYLMDSRWDPKNIVSFMKNVGGYGSKSRGSLAKSGADWGWDNEDITNEVLGEAWDDYYNKVRKIKSKQAYGGNPSLPNIESHYQKGGTKIYTDKALFDKAYKAETDSLNLYNLSNQLVRGNYGFSDNYEFPANPKYWEDYKIKYNPSGFTKDINNNKIPIGSNNTRKEVEASLKRKIKPLGYTYSDFAVPVYKKPVIHNVYQEPVPEAVKEQPKKTEASKKDYHHRQVDFSSPYGAVMKYYDEAGKVIREEPYKKPFGGIHSKTHTHMQEGGWLDDLDKYQGGGWDENFQRPGPVAENSIPVASPSFNPKISQEFIQQNVTPYSYQLPPLRTFKDFKGKRSSPAVDYKDYLDYKWHSDRNDLESAEDLYQRRGEWENEILGSEFLKDPEIKAFTKLDRLDDVYYDKSKENQYYIPSGKKIKLTQGRYNLGKIDTGLIDEVVKKAKQYGVDPLDILSIAGRESTFGQPYGDPSSVRRENDLTEVFSAWANSEANDGNFYNYFGKKKHPGLKLVKNKSGWNYRPEDESKKTQIFTQEDVDEYLKYRQEQEKIKSKDNALDFVAKKIKNKELHKYNPGDPDYQNKLANEKKLLAQEKELMKYLKSNKEDQLTTKQYGGWLDELDEEYRRGGMVNPLMKSRSKRSGTSKNIQSSINKLFLRNRDIFGPGGKNIYDPKSKYQDGGDLPKAQLGALLKKGAKAALKVAKSASPHGSWTHVEAIKPRTKLEKVIDVTKSLAKDVAHNVDKKIVTPIQFRKDIKQIKNKAAKQHEYFQKPEVVKKLEDIGASPSAIKFLQRPNQVDLSFVPNIGSHYDTVFDHINIDMRQAKKLSKKLGMTPMQAYEHELGHKIQQNIDLGSAEFQQKYAKYKKDLEDYTIRKGLQSNTSSLDPMAVRNMSDFVKNMDIPLPPRATSKPTLLDKQAAGMLRLRAKDKKLLTPEEKKILHYYHSEYPDQGISKIGYDIEHGAERVPHLREMRQAMIDKGHIENELSPITEDIVRNFIKENPSNRIAQFMDPNFNINYKKLVKTFKHLPALAPIGIGAAALQEEKDGGWLDKAQLGKIITRPLTLLTKTEMLSKKGKNMGYRKIGNVAGLQDLIRKKGAQAPAPMKMRSGLYADTPFFGMGKKPNENYKGIYAVEVDPHNPKYNWTSRVAGTDNLGVAPINPKTGELIKNIPLEDLNVYRKKWFSDNYKRLDPENLEEGLKNAKLQSGLENAWKWGVRGTAAVAAHDYMSKDSDDWAPQIQNYLNIKQKGGNNISESTFVRKPIVNIKKPNRQPTADDLAWYSMMAAQERQPDVLQQKQAQGKGSKAWDIMMNPFTAAGHMYQHGSIPDNFTQGPTSALDIAPQFVNPVTYAEMIYNTGKAAVNPQTYKDMAKTAQGLGMKAMGKEGPEGWQEAGLNTLGMGIDAVFALPGVKMAKGLKKNISKSINKSINKTAKGIKKGVSENMRNYPGPAITPTNFKTGGWLDNLH
jgi:hypothetical protein